MEEISKCEPGHIYIMFNEVFKLYGDNVYKIGKTKNIASTEI
jgi:hypothetical protein